MRSTIAFIAAAAVAPAAHAGFYITDAAPTAQGEVSIQPTVVKSESYLVPFAPRSNTLSPTAKRALGVIVASMDVGQSITIGSCGDPHDRGYTANRRVSAIKGWLSDNGVSDDAVSVDTDSVRDPLRSGGTYNCKLALSGGAPAMRMQTAYQGYAPPQPSPAMIPTAARAPIYTAPAADTGNSEQLALIRKVLDMVSAKAMKPEDALLMMQDIVKMGATTPAAQQNVAPPAPEPVPSYGDWRKSSPRMQYISARVEQPAYQPAQSAPPMLPQIKIEPKPITWTLEANKPLQDTLNDWAKSAGWKPVVWKASMPYLVSTSSEIPGRFVDALQAIASAVPALDFKADVATHQLVVSDANQY